MTHDQLAGKYARLRYELDAAYAEPEWSACRIGRIDRIAGELVAVERMLVSGSNSRLGMDIGRQAPAGRDVGGSLQR